MNINMTAAAAGTTIVMNTHTVTAMPADVDMTTDISIITLMRAAAAKNTTTNMGKNVVVGMNISTSMDTMCWGIRRTANAKFAIRTKNTVMYAAKVWKTAPAKCLTPTA